VCGGTPGRYPRGRRVPDCRLALRVLPACDPDDVHQRRARSRDPRDCLHRAPHEADANIDADADADANIVADHDDARPVADADGACPDADGVLPADQFRGLL
jgi:hypothetical protein